MGVKSYQLAADLLQPVLCVAMPRASRLVAPRSTVHVVARCNNREFYFTTAEDFDLLLSHLRELVRTYRVTLYAYTLMSNHVHLLLQAPKLDALGRPLRWFLTESARAFHRARGRRGHFWDRRYRACLVDDDLYALAALRCLDRDPVLVEDPTVYPWSSCAAYALGTPNRVITFHPSYLALSPYPKVRQRQYQALLAPSADLRADARDPRWSTQRAVGSPAFLERHIPRGGRRKSVFLPPQIQALGG